MEEIIYDKFISIGQNCCIAGALKILEYRDASYPFDWTGTYLKHVINCFKDNFTNFIAPLDELVIHKNVFSNPDKLITFFHDGQFKKLHKNYNNIINTYKRRIDRFLNILSSNEKILLIRKDFFNSDYLEYPISDIVELFNIITDKYPNIYLLLISNHTKQYNFDQNILHIQINNKKLDNNYEFMASILGKFKIKKKYPLNK